jgi:hypothetical protein
MPRNASTDPDSGLRYYIWKGERLLSVTSLRKVIGMPFPLHNWVVKRSIIAAFENGVAAEAAGEVMADRPILDSLDPLRMSAIRKASMGERDSAADRGTAVHAAIEQGATPADVDPALAPYVRHYTDACRTLGIVPLVQEAQVWNPDLGYAGSLDMLGTVFTGTENEALGIIDLKTGKGLYLDHVLQTLAYGMAEFVGKDDLIDEAATELLRKVNGLFILHLTETGWEFLELAPDPAAWKAFESMARLANFLARNDTITPYISRQFTGAAS